ncbi:hypothetical protein GAMM_140035 [Gammaproteobacteria bacterium]
MVCAYSRFAGSLQFFYANIFYAYKLAGYATGAIDSKLVFPGCLPAQACIAQFKGYWDNWKFW